MIEQMSWLPYKACELLFDSEEEVINIDLKGIDKKFYFHVSSEDKGLSTQLRVFGFREPINLEYYYKFIEKDDVVLDIGANVGLFTVLSHNAKRIICVEPLEQVIPILKKNILENNLQNKTKILNCAIGEKGTLILEVDKKLNLSRIVNKKNKNTFEVESFKLKEIVEKHNPNTLRLDVEGYEYEILYNKIPKSIKKISLEFHTELLGKKKVKDLLRYFKDEGFLVKYFVEDLPIRLYPFHDILKKIGLIKKLTYVKENLDLGMQMILINKGRSVKYLFLNRK